MSVKILKAGNGYIIEATCMRSGSGGKRSPIPTSAIKHWVLPASTDKTAHYDETLGVINKVFEWYETRDRVDGE